MTKRRKLSSLSLSLLVLLFSAFPLHAKATTYSALPGVIWEGDKAIISQVVDGSALSTELWQHGPEKVTGVEFTANSGLKGSCNDLFTSLINATSITFDPSFVLDPSVTNLSQMFAGCESLKSLSLPGGFDTTNVESMYCMFYDCKNLESLSLPTTFNANGIENTGSEDGIAQMFASCSSLKTLDLGGLTTKNAKEEKIQQIGCFLENTLAIPIEITGYVKSLSTLICRDGCLFQESNLDVDFPITDITSVHGSYFNYPGNNGKGWNVYNALGNLVATNLKSEAEFATCQENNPGILTYKWADQDPDPTPTPEPTPDPEPTPGEPGWYQDENGWQYFDENGDLVHGWLDLDGVWFYFDDAGYAVHDSWLWNEDFGAHWYYFWSDCSMAANAWLWDGAWYYVCSSGPMIQGNWQWIDNAWYGFWWNGVMCQGWVWDSDYVAWFYCYENGAMAKNAWVDGCYLNDNGIWIY